ncbi:MAG: glycine cleavage system aminomethyltransferase GcvT [Thermoplasmata archaeon]|nr:glycine cleavage system aminomethyltransferase GcvT [Thermoplasmata archaeon]
MSDETLPGITPTPGPSGPAPPLKRTALYPFHLARGGHLVPFGGWEMPLYYHSILDEHRAVREGVGLFDVGHMGIVTVVGGHAAPMLSRRTTANVERIAPGQCRYTFLTEFNGAILDDLLVTRLDAHDPRAPGFLVVPNAARAGKVVDILREHRRPDTEITVHNPGITILAVQGPGSRALLESHFGWSLAGLKFYHGAWFPTDKASGIGPDGALGKPFPGALDHAIFVSRTGYTGELGFELFLRADDAVAIAERLAGAGAVPCGLGARDTLRQEKGFLLSGQDFNRDRTPLEAGQERFVEWDHPFVGREALEAEKKAGPPVRWSGIRTDEADAIPRHGTPILVGDRLVAHATSGGRSPTLQTGIALAFLPPPLDAPGTVLALEIRGKSVPAHVVPLPFLATGGARRPYTPTPP